MVIPSGSRIKIYRNGKLIPSLESAKLITKEDIQISVSSEYEKLVGDKIAPIASLISGFTKDIAGVSFSGAFKEFGFQVWTGTNQLAITLNADLIMRNSGEIDVVNPAKDLMKLAVPTEASLFTSSGELNIGNENQTFGVGLVPPGPSILSVFNKGTKNSNSYSVRVGKFLFKPVIVKKVDTVLNKATDTSDYPISASVTIDIESIYIPTAAQIDRLGRD